MRAFRRSWKLTFVNFFRLMTQVYEFRFVNVTRDRARMKPQKQPRPASQGFPPRLRGIVADAAALGISRYHLWCVLKGKRRSASLLKRYRDLLKSRLVALPADELMRRYNTRHAKGRAQ